MSDRPAKTIKPGDLIRIKNSSALVSASYPSPVLEGGWRLTIEGEDYPVPPEMSIELANQAIERISAASRSLVRPSRR